MISISIVSHCQNSLVNRLLNSLVEIESELDMEIIVVENVHDIIDIKNDFPGIPIKVVRNPEPYGLAKNQNAVFRLAQGDFFCVINPDVLWVEPILNHLQKLIENGTADVIAPLIVDRAGEPQDSFRDLPTPLELFQRRFLGLKLSPLPFMKDEIVRPDWIAGTFLFIRSEVFRQLRGFDERYRLYFEDVDFCSRARLSGFKIIVDTRVRLVHEARRQSRRNLKYLVWHISGAFRFFTSPVYKSIRRIVQDS